MIDPIIYRPACEAEKSYFVTGCGVSVICDSRDSVLSWVMDLIDRGGTPTVELIGRDA